MTEPTFPTMETNKAYQDLISIYQDLASYNTGRQFGFSNNLLAVAQQLLSSYNEQCLAYIEDEEDYKSLLSYIAGDDELEKWNLFRGIFEKYSVALF